MILLGWDGDWDSWGTIAMVLDLGGSEVRLSIGCLVLVVGISVAVSSLVSLPMLKED